MANNDSSSYTLRFNEVTSTLEYSAGLSWITVPGVGSSVTAGEINSESATIGQVLTADGAGGASWEDAGGATPGGADTQVQFNDSGSFGGEAALTWTGTSLVVDGTVDTASVTTSDSALTLQTTSPGDFVALDAGGDQVQWDGTALTLPDTAALTGNLKLNFTLTGSPTYTMFYDGYINLEGPAGGTVTINSDNPSIDLVRNGGSPSLFLDNGTGTGGLSISTTDNNLKLDAATGMELLPSSGKGVFISHSTGGADASASFQIETSGQGAILPRMDTTTRDAIASPAEGLIIYNTTTHVLNFYNGTTWGAV